MTFRLSLLCGALFAGAGFASAAFALLDVPRQAMNGVRTKLTTCALPGLRCAPQGVFLHQRTIGPPPDAALGLPDPATLVSSAWADLTDGPLKLDLPTTGARFFAAIVIDANDRTIALADATSFGRDGGALILEGPADASGAGTAVQPGTDQVWIVARFGVADEADVVAVRALQEGLRVTRLPRR